MTCPEPRTVADRIETVVVDPTNVVEAFEQNRDDETEHRRHVLRISPPFESDVKAVPHVLDDRDSPSDVDSTAVHLRPETFVSVRDDYDRYRTRVSIPTRRESRSIARSDHGENVDTEVVEEYHTTAMEAWEECVRTSLVDEILLLPDPKPENEVWIDVQYEER
ncbi:hypothetical protein Htur_4156 (plasmid) [Haloterrigena turkmenica DSM 5511]|uniref:DUF8009 domain-containing protein n=1 Tax=Haloterrigena turkmenica (strain ATCC 51198 / DSM 5511 / JCM 9101 / NCIMB 13204 / VKM B-1734 / 4k) TaxID=543526 RepID=D2S0T2_HALTV|nr:hypothetical protein Htur_4156 [Haloterrigena turkmenica DSM 5511]